jgi:hypothetical protein
MQPAALKSSRDVTGTSRVTRLCLLALLLRR